MNGRLTGKVALITGGTSGIGAGTVRRFVAEGAKVVFTGSNKTAALALSQETGAVFYQQRVEDADAWPALMANILAQFGRLDIAVGVGGGRVVHDQLLRSVEGGRPDLSVCSEPQRLVRFPVHKIAARASFRSRAQGCIYPVDDFDDSNANLDQADPF